MRTTFATLIALLALALGCAIAGHHPLSPVLAIAFCIAAAGASVVVRDAWLFLLPALLPVVDLAPWTGWLTFEEFDILVLGSVAGAWLRHGWISKPTHASPTSFTLTTLLALLAIGTAASVAVGLQEAGGFAFGWFQGYDGPMNSVRLSKSLFLALLFVPLLGATNSRQNPRSTVLFHWGMATGLGLASLATIWERLAFTGLLNFSTDYRTTALFWEMHVGGAALDGFLAMTVPFAVLALWRARGPAQILPAVAIVTVATYACLTTFSRGVYLSEAASLAVLALMLIARRPATGANLLPGNQAPFTAAVLGALLAGLALVLSFLVFRNGGYRALTATLCVLAIFLFGLPVVRNASAKTWAIGIMASLIMISISFLAGWLTIKGPYWSFAGIFLLAAGTLAAVRYRKQESLLALVLGGMISIPVAALQIADHWGGRAATWDSTIALVTIYAFGIWNIFAASPIWPSTLRKQSATLVGIISLAAVTAVFSGGAYIGDRFSASQHDFGVRLAHWNAALELLRSPTDWLFGKGSGRFPASFFFGAPNNEFPGTYRVNQEANNTYLSLTGPYYKIGYGEVLRIGQRVTLGPPGRYLVEFDARVPATTTLHVAICTKHLLYPDACAHKQFQLGADARWQHQSFDLDGRSLIGGPWYAPQLAIFTIDLETLRGRVDIDNVVVSDTVGRTMTVNGAFSENLSRWFFSSDRQHMPWHMKNMFLHMLFEQGIVGLSLFVVLIVVALSRSLRGRRSYHPLAPAMVAAIVGFVIVGLFDSLLDVPRLAFLFYLMLMIAVQGQLKAVPAPPAAGGNSAGNVRHA